MEASKLTRPFIQKLHLSEQLFLCLLISLFICSPVIGDDEYFYCRSTNLDGSEPNHLRYKKGSDFEFNKNTNRWEWLSKSFSHYIYPNGRYEEISHTPGFSSRTGICNSDAERLYKEKIAEMKRLYGK